MRRHRVITLPAIALAVLILAACGGSADPAGTSDNPAATGAAAGGSTAAAPPNTLTAVPLGSPVAPPATTTTTPPPAGPADQSDIDAANRKLTTGLGDQPAEPASSNLKVPPSAPGASEEQVATDFVDFVIKDVAQFWAAGFDANALEWTYPQYLLLQGDERYTAACTDGRGNNAVVGNPDKDSGVSPAFYCDADDTVYLDLPWVLDHIWRPHAGQDQQKRLGGDFGVATMIAHEMGHAVQHKIGIELPLDATTVKPIELQADCLSGVWANSKFVDGTLEAGDITEAFEAEEDAGDYNFYRPGHHGTPIERAAAWATGYDAGAPNVCTLELGLEEGPAGTTGGGSTTP